MYPRAKIMHTHNYKWNRIGLRSVYHTTALAGKGGKALTRDEVAPKDRGYHGPNNISKGEE
jgi:hypothetical protein